MLIQKFGGTSLKDADRILQAVRIIQAARERSGQVVVVCSAMGSVTDALLGLARHASVGENADRDLHTLADRHLVAARALGLGEGVRNSIEMLIEELRSLMQGMSALGECSPRALDRAVSFGERLSTHLVVGALKQADMADTVFLDAREVIQTDSQFGSARVDVAATNKLVHTHPAFAHAVVVATGFIASNREGDTTTLGRGGSDYTASILGAALGADAIEIWTDVDGVLTADPRRVPDARRIESMSYEEAMELSHFGAKVIYPPTMVPALQHSIPLLIKNSFHPECPGTLITQTPEKNGVIKGLSAIDRVAILRLHGPGMIGISGIAGRFFTALAAARVNVIMITQGSSEHSICVAVSPDDAVRALHHLKTAFALEIHDGSIEDIECADDLSIIAVVGEGMRERFGIAGRIFQALGAAGVNVVAIAQGSSERNVSFAVPQEAATCALQAIHNRFFTAKEAPIQVALIGTGLIGTTLLDQIAARPTSASPTVDLVGVINSRRMMLADQPSIPPNDAPAQMEHAGEPADLDTFIDRLLTKRYPNLVVVDCTASSEPPKRYEHVLRSGASVVTPNKRAAAGSYATYRTLQTARNGRNRFLYETNVGAGLPVIGTLRSLINSGDSILRIEGVLSGTLSYLFNRFQPDDSFTDLLREAHLVGYTEPDPRDDLSGMDVARKALILAREMGLAIEIDDIEIESLVPEDCKNAVTVEMFFETLRAHDAAFSERAREAAAQEGVLRYLTSVEPHRVRVGLEIVPLSHSAAHLSGSDNLISFTTKHYRDRPLVVQGPGAGAEVTAAGVLSDILSCVSL